MDNEENELVQAGFKMYDYQYVALMQITKVVQASKPRRKYSVTCRECVDEGIKVLKERYGIEE